MWMIRLCLNVEIHFDTAVPTRFRVRISKLALFGWTSFCFKKRQKRNRSFWPFVTSWVNSMKTKTNSSPSSKRQRINYLTSTFQIGFDPREKNGRWFRLCRSPLSLCCFFVSGRVIFFPMSWETFFNDDDCEKSIKPPAAAPFLGAVESMVIPRCLAAFLLSRRRAGRFDKKATGIPLVCGLRLCFHAGNPLRSHRNWSETRIHCSPFFIFPNEIYGLPLFLRILLSLSRSLALNC